LGDGEKIKFWQEATVEVAIVVRARLRKMSATFPTFSKIPEMSRATKTIYLDVQGDLSGD